MRRWPRFLLPETDSRCYEVCSAESQKAVVMADDHRAGDGASCSVVKESPCVMVTSEPRPEGDMGRLSVLMSLRSGGWHLRAHCKQRAALRSLSKVSIHFKAHNTWGYILILLYPCLCVSQAPGVMQPRLTSNLTRH